MATLKEIVIRELHCGTASVEEGDEAFMVIEMPSSKLVTLVRLEKIQKNGYVILNNCRKREKYKVLPSSIVEINDTLRRMSIVNSFADSNWNDMKIAGKTVVL